MAERLRKWGRKSAHLSLPEEKFLKTIDKLKKIKYNKDTKKTKNKFKKEVLNYGKDEERDVCRNPQGYR